MLRLSGCDETKYCIFLNNQLAELFTNLCFINTLE